MRKKWLLGLIVVALLVIPVSLIGCGGGNGDTEDKVYEMSFQLRHARGQYVVQEVHIPFANALEERSNGKLKVDVFDWGNISTDPLDAVASGMLTMAVVECAIYPGRFPLAEILNRVSFLIPSGTIAGKTHWHLYQKYPELQAEYPDEVMVLGLHGAAVTQLHMSNGPIKTIDDFKGKRIQTWSPAGVERLAALGGTGIYEPPADTAMNLDRGLVDGVQCPIAPLRGFGIAGLTPYTTICNLNASTFNLLINKEFFESLPKDLQDIILSETGDKWWQEGGRGLDEGSVIDAQYLKEEYDEWQIYVVPDDELKKWSKVHDSVLEEYMKEVESLGLGEIGREILSEIYKIVPMYIEEGLYIPDLTFLF